MPHHFVSSQTPMSWHHHHTTSAQCHSPICDVGISDLDESSIGGARRYSPASNASARYVQVKVQSQCQFDSIAPVPVVGENVRVIHPTTAYLSNPLVCFTLRATTHNPQPTT